MSPRRIAAPAACSTVALLLALAPGLLWASAASDKAQALTEKGDLRGAVIELKSALQQDPNDVDARLALAKLYLRSANGEAAEKEILAAVELGADASLWRLDLVEALVQQARFDEAVQRLENAADLSEKDQARAFALRGIAALGKDEPDRARDYFGQALAIDPENQAAGVGAVRVELKEGNRDAAVQAADALLARFPDNVDALLIRAELYRNAGSAQEALALLDRAIAAEPRNLLARLGRATALVGLKEPEQARKELAEVESIQSGVPLVSYLRGVIDFQEKNWRTAAEHLDRMLSLVPNHPQSQLLLGIIRYSENELETADELIGSALKTMPDNVQAIKVLAATRIKMREPDRAIEILEPHAQGGDPQLLALLGSAYMLKGDLERGQEWLNKAVEDAPDVAALRTQLALTLLAGGQTDKAIDELQSAVDLGQDILQADVLLVLAHLKNKQLDEALKASEALERRRADSPIPYNLTGLALMAKGDLPAARARFEKALAVDPAFVTADINLARIEVAAKDLDAAQRRYEKVLETSPKHLGALLGLAALADQRKDVEGLVAALERAQDANPTATQPGLLLARFYIARGDYLKALSVASDLSARFPEDEAALQMLARAQTLGGQVPSAIRTFEELLQRHPDDPQLNYLTGGARWKAQDYAGAQRAFEHALALKPDFVDARVALASVSLDAGDTDTALSSARALQGQYPDAGVGYRVEGAIYAARREPDKAAEAFKKAFERERSSPVVRQLADSLQQGGKTEEAVRILDGWVKEQPDDLDAQAMLGLFLQQTGSPKEAIAVYERVVAKMTKKNPLLLNNLAWLYQEQGDARAKAIAKEAYDLAPGRPEVADTYGWILYNSGSKEEGLSILQQAYLAFPTQSEIGWHVAVALDGLGRKDEAIQILSKVLRDNPKAPEAEEAKKLLEKLKG